MLRSTLRRCLRRSNSWAANGEGPDHKVECSRVAVVSGNYPISAVLE
jgi:hypothetical protein